MRDMYVEEIMTRAPVIGSPDLTAREAAFLMKSWKVGSVIVVEDGAPIGIVTERDFVDKIVAENKMPSKVIVREIMSSPLITIDPRTSIEDAARRMSSLGVRRLPVVVGDQLVGMVTENDILKLSPSLIELTREWNQVRGAPPAQSVEGEGISGYCENCENYSYDLRIMGGVGGGRGSLLCPECRDIFVRDPID